MANLTFQPKNARRLNEEAFPPHKITATKIILL